MLARRPSELRDETFLRSVFASTRALEIALSGWSAAQADVFLRMQFDAQHHHYQAQYPDARFDVVELDGAAIGRITTVRRPQTIHLIDIALLPAWQRRGHGAALLRAVQDEAARDGCGVKLQVQLDNPAQQLYQRLGFEDVGVAGISRLMEWRPRAR
jgi:ribosomal protein S18 acetylase RimI-like enzyme